MGRAGKALLIGVLVVVCANVLVYTARQANPVIASDDWVYLDSFVRKAARSDLSLADFFVKRSAMDHANPLRRLVLLAHYKWLDLDYGVQALVGVMFAFANLGLLWVMSMPKPGNRDASRALPTAFIALAAIYLSLNAGTVYTWPLLTLAFSSQFFVLACILQAWKANAEDAGRRSAFALFGAAFAMDAVTDDTGLLVTIAILLATAAWQFRGEARRTRLAHAFRAAMLPVLAAFAIYKLLYFVVTRGAVIAAPLSDRLSLANKLHSLWDNLPTLLAGLHVPMVAALMQKTQINRLFGPQAGTAELALAALMLAAHGWFWWRAFKRRPGMAGFAAMVLMLYFYGAVAGILVGRAAIYGAGYFWQPRYVLLYQLSIVALIMMAMDAMSAACAKGLDGFRMSWVRAAAVVLAVAVLLLQCRLSAVTWGGAQSSSRFQARLARQIGELAAHPDRIPNRCAPALIICRYPVEQRTELVYFLKENKLNVFSPSFQARYRLYPDSGP
jgi:hypothetical protein